MSESFGLRLWNAVEAHGPLCVGIDPHSSLLDAWGLSDDAAGAERFGRTVVEALAGRVPVVKPQSAFFERFGSAGVLALERTIADARAAGLLVVTDVKRGDIGTTAAAYAHAYLDPASPLCSDALTVSPYLGFGSLQPFLDAAEAHGGGVFVLALTSNPEGPQVQHARTPDGRTVAGTMLAAVAAHNAGQSPQGSVGVVIGATIGDTAEDLAVNGPLLVPGLGAQGGGADDLRRLFGPVARYVLPSMSREILGAGPDLGRLAEAASRAGDLYATVLR
ncbi:orotidine-5'-phosphate decarboxylase [Sporichthya sp.]|uniref:orotidine-5'-phosphate decarboxylase n=1 Tax=Sporichthya sp. TaxID=65475 RepID=UPI0018327D26|nr:orotidine-5'-phosphate decarboxylase [Sporichthya sp.]MBA3745422.1 orotidine-5'-phosphate decarboxylase [Sporichthya sp.]